MGFVNHPFFAEHDPFLARLREDPDFEELMERARATQPEVEAEAWAPTALARSTDQATRDSPPAWWHDRRCYL
jgi:hypothetical protein